MTPRLSDSFPWSEEELGGFAVSAVAASVLFALLYAWSQGPDAGTMVNPHVPMGSPAYLIRIPDPTYVTPLAVGALTLLGLFLLNVSPLKRLHGSAQFLTCMAAGGLLGRHEWALDGIVISTMKATTYGFLIFSIYRVNWWFYWDVPSRSTVGQRVAASIFFTALPMLGLGFGVLRLVARVGIHEPTTTFLIDADGPFAPALEAIVEDQALEEHQRRMSAIRAAQAGVGSGRTPSANKDSVSESI
jgi:hypothetical protein